MFVLWVLSWVLFFVNKIPFIKPIVTIASFYYGRTTIWKVLVKIRKAFINFNAIIGVYMVYKTTDFSYDNILAGFAGMGHQYLEIFMNFTKRLFYWFVELFDHKIVPNVPNNPSLPKGDNGIWTPLDYKNNPILNNFTPESSLREWYKTPLNIYINTTPWYKDLTTWLWIAGVANSLGVLYCGYGYSKLNPYNWFLGTPSTTAEASFLDRQSKINTYDDRFYPFTNINPYAPRVAGWDRLRVQIFGESLAEINERMIDKDYAMSEYLAIAVDKAAKGSQTPVSTCSLTPNIAALGVGIKIVSGSSFMEAIEASTSSN
jgi:hypothetical protein